MALCKHISAFPAGRARLGPALDPAARSPGAEWRGRAAGSSGGGGTLAPFPLTVAILAGGLGTRLRPVVSDRPKVIADVGGRPFLEWSMDALDRHGFRDVVLCAGYQSERLSQTLGSRQGNLQLRYSVEDQPLGTGGALRHALPLLKSDLVLVLNGDSFCEVNLRAFLEAHVVVRARASLVIARLEETGRFGRVTLRPDWTVQDFHEKSSDPEPGWINAGIYLFRRDLLAGLPDEQPISLERDLLPRWLAEGIHGFPATGKFIDIGTPESLAQAEGFFAGLHRAAA